MTTVAAHGRADHGLTSLMAGGLLAVVAAIVLGILGMHAFAQAPMKMTGTDHNAAAATSVEARGHDMASMTLAPMSASSPDMTVVEVPAPAHSMGDMVMLCAAMLLVITAGILLALRLRQRAPKIPISLRPRPPNHAFPRTARIGIGLPAEWRFSVVRC